MTYPETQLSEAKYSEIKTINGMEMYYEIHGKGEPLLLLHGFTGSSSDWETIIPSLPSEYQFIIPDLRGHGRSTNPLETYTHRQAALDVLALLEHLNVEQFKALGISGGGLALLHIATQQPERVQAMVLVSATSHYPTQARTIMKQMTESNRTEEEWNFMRQRHKQGDSQIRALWKQGHAFKDSYDDMNFTPPYLSTITASTLIIHGDQDPLYPINIPVEMHTAIPHSYLWVIPNEGHVPIFGKMMSQFLTTVSSFLNGEF